VKQEVVKVQRPLSHPTGGWLVYDSRRGRTQLINKPSAALQTAMGDHDKIYCNATWDGWQWTIGERVADQPW
jgi:hypothetical protein